MLKQKKKNLKMIIFVLLLFSSLTLGTWLSENKSGEIEKELTLREKVGQMLIVGFEGKVLDSNLENFIKEIKPGGLLFLARNIEDQEQLKKLISDLKKFSSNLPLPLFFVVDQEGGPISRVTFLKQKTPQSQIENTTIAFNVGFERGRELRELGFNLNLAPLLDWSRPGDFIYQRTFQKEPQTIGELAFYLILGQKKAGILTAVKHFPGYGNISFNPERESLPILKSLPPIDQFKIAIASQPEFIMTANVIYQKIDDTLPFGISQKGIQFLKRELGEDVLILSDDLSSKVLKKSFSLKETLVLAVNSGVDILIVAGFDDPQDPKKAIDFLVEGVKEGKISEETIDRATKKIIKIKKSMLK